MGNSPSQDRASQQDAQKLQQLEAMFQSGGDLAHLRAAFNFLSTERSPETTAAQGESLPVLHAQLKETFSLPFPEGPPSVQAAVRGFNDHLIEAVFGQTQGKVSYGAFLEAVAGCGRRGSKRDQIRLLLQAFVGRTSGWEDEERAQSGSRASTSAASGLESESMADVSREQLEGILLTVWYLTALVRRQNLLKEEAMTPGFQDSTKSGVEANTQEAQSKIEWPDLSVLLNGVFAAKQAKGDTEKDGSSDRVALSTLLNWGVAAFPGLSIVLEPYIFNRCCAWLSQKEKSEKKDSGQKEGEQGTDAAPSEAGQDHGISELQSEGEEDKTPWRPGILTSATAWSMGLALTSGATKWGVGPRLIDLGCGGGDLTWLVGKPRLLYKSSENGRGMNRFMSHVEGYPGTVLVIIAARPIAGGESWSIAALLPDGLANRRAYFGSSGSCLFALKPNFQVFRSTGRESNFVFCHAKVAGQGYQSHPLPEGLGFGGALGKERVWLDDNETPGKVTVRHHAVDKTFQLGALVPDLGYAGVEGRVEDVEVWGLGGQQADAQQRAYLDREQRFQEQRRKIDMKKFAESWQDSPDKLILEWGGART